MTPANLDQLRAIADPAERAVAAAAYIAAREQAIDTARQVRDEAILLLLDAGFSASQAADACRVSRSLVKQVKRLAPALTG